MLETGAALEQSARCSRSWARESLPTREATAVARRARRADRADPLAVDDAAVDRLETAAAAFETTLRQLRDLPERLERTRALIERAQLAAREGQEAHAEVMRKIVAPVVPAPLDDDKLEAELEQVAALARDGAWEEAVHALIAAPSTPSAGSNARGRSLAENRAPIARRNELRGLLDAYCGKARRLGLIEDPRSPSCSPPRRPSLYSAPTDLEQADELVRRYANALSDGREVLL